ncbi:MAG TPA: hypothetical protein VJN67_18655 [Stellaceae bacterium]|nr:hypothetical protein [Stellaceae bacterium]
MLDRGVVSSQNHAPRQVPPSAQSPSLNGPHLLNAQVIGRTVTRKSAGVYVVNSVAGGAATPRFVGRADDDLAARLKEYVGLYASFAFVYASSPASAYEIECQIYHALRPPESTRHPAKPAGAEGACPVCGAEV